MNEKVYIVGFRNVSFTDDAGRKVEGYTLYWQQEPVDDKVSGLICGKQFVSSQYVDYVPCLGDTVIFRYNKYGKIGAVEVV